jgi:hypothetical protein
MCWGAPALFLDMTNLVASKTHERDTLVIVINSLSRKNCRK